MQKRAEQGGYTRGCMHAVMVRKEWIFKTGASEWMILGLEMLFGDGLG